MKNQTISQVLFSAKGRINRQKYILSLFLYTAIITFLLIMSGIFGGSAAEVEGFSFSALMSMLFVGLTFISYILFTYSAIVLNIKRWHDLDKSGWFILLQFVPIANIVCMFILIFIKGTVGSNRFGEDLLA